MRRILSHAGRAVLAPVKRISCFPAVVQRVDWATALPLIGLLILLTAIAVLWSIKDRELTAQVIAGKLELKDFYALENSITGTAAQVAGGAVVLFGAFLTLRNLWIAREGQVTARFIQAIAQLGGDNPAVRLGGIYALERVAWDSNRDHATVVDVLTAYVREQVPWPPRDSARGWPRTASGTDQERPSSVMPKPAQDIQAILTILGRRKPSHRRSESYRLNLETTDLRGAQLFEAHFENANLGRAALDQVIAQGAHFENAFLWGASLRNASFRGAHLEGASFGWADLQGASLVEAHLQGAFLEDASLEGTDLRRAHMEGADLRRVRGLSPQQLRDASTNNDTVFPDYWQTMTTDTSSSDEATS